MDPTQEPAVLVTGGAGDIGAHAARPLAAAGFRPIVFDNLSCGFRDVVQRGPFAHGDVRGLAALSEATGDRVGLVLHSAGLIEVGRSTPRPDLFWEMNVGGAGQVLAAMRASGVPRMVFSSSAAAYGQAIPGGPTAISEDAPKSPSGAYGDTKLAGERVIAAHCRAFGTWAVTLCNFNAAGAHPADRIGEAHDPEIRLSPLAIAAARDDSPPLTVVGDDFDTPDSTCLRDYVHVVDLAEAHVAALRGELAPGAFEALNLGGGADRSVREVIAAAGEVFGRAPRTLVGPRRDGHPASLMADTARAQARLGWTPSRSSLRQIVRDAGAWERNPAYGVGQRAAVMAASPRAAA